MRNSDVAYDRIKKMIITTELKPGQAIVESELMELLNVGRTPVREALNRLAVENFIKIIPRHCIMVTDVSVYDIESIYQMRLTLVGLVAELATKNRTPEELEEVKRIMEELASEKDQGRRVLLDRKFHLKVAGMTRNSFLEKDMSKYLDLCARLLFLNQNHLSAIDDMDCATHEEMYDCLVNGDAEKMAAIEREHVLEFKNKFMQF